MAKQTYTYTDPRILETRLWGAVKISASTQSHTYIAERERGVLGRCIGLRISEALKSAPVLRELLNSSVCRSALSALSVRVYEDSPVLENFS